MSVERLGGRGVLSTTIFVSRYLCTTNVTFQEGVCCTGSLLVWEPVLPARALPILVYVTKLTYDVIYRCSC